MLSDLRLSCRALAKSRGFTVIAVLTLAVGIGSTTAIFSALQALVIAPFSYPASEQLTQVWSGDNWSLSPADYFDLHDQVQSFSTFGAYQPTLFNVGQENAQSVIGVTGTAGVLRALGVQPTLGRLFTDADDAEGAPPVAIISHAIWRERFASDPAAIGKKLRLDGKDVVVVGVMPASFDFVSPWMRTESPQIWVPRLFSKDERKARDSHYLLGIARLRDGVSIPTADAEIKTIGKRLTQLYPDSNTHKEFLVRSLHEDITRGLSKQAWLLFGAVTLVLLVACGNVASMLLARSTRRQGEFAVRVALGASPRHLIRLALAESFVLALLGTVVGLGFALGGTKVLQLLTPVSAARKAAISLNVPALEFALAATAVTALLAGLPPAFSALRTSLAGVMRSDARGAVGSPTRHALLRDLIIVQVAVAFMLANAAVLFSSGYLKLLQENQLLDSDAVFTAKIALHQPSYPDDAAEDRFWYDFVRRLQSLPGVTRAAITSKLPLEGGNNTNGLVNDETYDPTQQRLQIERTSVTEDYFSTLGIRLLKGRMLRSEDRTGDIRGVLVNQRLVEKAWPHKEPLGEIIRGDNPGKPWYTVRVVGVVENVKQWGADAEVQPEMYTTPEGHWGHSAILVVRSSLPLSQLAPLLRRELAALDPELALNDLRTMHAVVAGSTQGQRAVAGLVDFFMSIALGLVAVGLYGTLSYHVQHRTREIGVRVALGAVKRDVIRLVFAQGARWVVVGLVIGLVGIVALASTLKALVYHMDGLTAPPLLIGAAGVALAAAIACWLPARRAARLDPSEALRSD